jgi:predicted DNA-binding transcriptional regulator AlpA
MTDANSLNRAAARLDRPLLVPQEQAPRLLGLSRAAFFRLRAAGDLPAPVHVPGAGIVFRLTDLERWAARLKPRRRKRSADPPAAA